MSGSNWDDLSSRNERLVQPPEPLSAQGGATAMKWAELDSQRERLAESSPAQAGPGSRSASLRLVAGAA
ncbi:MAG: hypothetical protein ACLQFR_14635 [Streptosporangiaceae bacterium]